MATALIGALAIGLWRLFDLRFAAGDIYPDYSTRNSGPTGGKAIFESLEQLPDFKPEQNYVPLMRLENVEGATLVFAGAGEGFFGRDSAKNFAKFEGQLERNAHVIATLSASSIPPWTDHEVDQPIEDLWHPGDLGLPLKKQDELPAATRWEFAFVRAVDKKRQPRDGWRAIPASAAGRDSVERVAGAGDAAIPGSKTLATDVAPGSKTPATDAIAGSKTPATQDGNPPQSLPRWFSPWRFVVKGSDWQTLAVVDDKPVIIQRSFGTGSLTLVSDSTFLSNEALWRAPHPEFLLWLFGKRPRIIFDETHHGTRTDPGVMYLVRRYRLSGFFAGVAVLLALFVWRASSSVVPASSNGDGGGRDVLDRADATVGMRNFMKQNIPAKFLLAACFTEWAKSSLVRRKYADAQVTAVRDLVKAAPARPSTLIVKAYRSIGDFLRRSF